MIGLVACNHTLSVQANDPITEVNLPVSNEMELLVQVDAEQVVAELEPVEPIVINSATLVAVGDILIHSSVWQDAKTDEGYDFKPMFELVKPYIEQADIAIANQETMIGGTELGLTGYPRFNSPYEVGDALKDSGFDIVSLANNHTLDRGEKAINNAIAHWNEIGMAYTGAYVSTEDKQRIRTIEKNGITFSFLSYTYGTNGLPIPEGKDYLVNLIDIEQMKEDVELAKQLADVVVASVHFGNEYEELPNESQKIIAQELAKLGVDIVIGHHPHVLQPVEWIEQESGRKTFVVYSLGNFIAAQDGLERELGGIVQIEVEKVTEGEKETITLKNPSFIPTLAYKKNYRNYKIIPLEDCGEEYLKQAEQVYESVKAHMNQWVVDLNFLVPKDQLLTKE